MYCAYETYLKRGGTMDSTQYAVYGARAAACIDRLTLGRAAAHAALLADALAAANARMAELLLTADTAAARAVSGLTGANTDGGSESYTDPGTARRARDAELLNALQEELGADPYGLLWQGVL